MSDFYIRYRDKYKDIIIVDYNDRIYKDGKVHVKATCPCCLKERYIQINNAKRMKSSLCGNCSTKTERIFKQDEDSLWYTMCGSYKIIVDYEDIEKLRNKSISVLTSTDNKNMPYAVIKKNNKSQTMTHFILGIKDSKIIVDHENHNTLDNRKINLRIADTHFNGLNAQMKSSNKSGFKNISLNDRSNRWSVDIFRKNEKRLRKRFYTFIEAYSFWRENSNKEFRYDILRDSQIELRFADVTFDDVANGDGLGAVVFSQFCSHHCKNCQNPQTWSKNGGKVFTEDTLNNLFSYYDKAPFASRLTLSGGDPLENLPLSNLIASEFKYHFPNKSLWIYTGYTYEDIKDKYEYQAILELCDYLVDGLYIDELRDVSLQFRGSSNQRVINVQQSLKENKIVLYN